MMKKLRNNVKSKNNHKVFILFLLPLLAFSQGSFQSLHVPTTARELAVGVQGVTFYGTVNSLFSSPSVMQIPENKGWNFSYIRFPAQIEFSSGSFALSINARTTIGFGVRYFSYGDFPLISAEGEESGSFNASEIASTAALSYNILNRLKVGANITYVHERIASYSSEAIPVVLSLAYHEPSSTLTVIYSSLMPLWGSSRDELMRTHWFGVSKHLAHLPLWIHTAAQIGNDGFKSLNVGGEFHFGSLLYLSWGFSTKRFDLQTTILNQDLIAGTSFGAGLVMNQWRFDVALSSLGGAGAITAFTISNEVW